MNRRSYAFLPFLIAMIVASVIVPGFSTPTRPNLASYTPTDQAVQVWFNGSPQLTILYPTNYEFNAAAKTSSGFWITNLHWDFGDNSSLDVPFSAQSQVSDTQYHAYSQPGTYTVTVTAYDNIGNSGNAQVTVNWSAGQQLDPPTTDYTVQISSGIGGTVSYTYALCAPHTNASFGGCTVPIQGTVSPGGTKQLSVPQGTRIALTATPPDAFQSWTNTDSVSVSSSSPSTTITVNRDGSVAANFATTGAFDYSLSVDPSTLTIVSGQSAKTTITLSLVSGTPEPVGFMIYPLPQAVIPVLSQGSVSPPATVTLTITTGVAGPTPAGTYEIPITGEVGGVTPQTAVLRLIVTGGGGLPCTGPLGVTISTNSANIQLGQSATFTASASGGSCSGYNYVWYWSGGTPANQGSQNSGSSNTYTFTPTNAGIYGLYAVVTDSTDIHSQSSTVPVTVQCSSCIPTTGSLQVQVYSQSTGNPINGATVAMTSAPSGQSAQTGVTGSSGQYTFPNILVGSYSVSVNAQGDQPSSGSGTVSSGQREP